MLHTLDIQTDRHDQMIDITARIQDIIDRSGLKRGMVLIYCPHTTAGVTINENVDPDVRHDILMRLNEMCPWRHPQDRHREGNSAAHLKAGMMGFSQIIAVTSGGLLLGRWQGIYFCEFDGPRRRSLYVQVLQDGQ